MNLLTSVIYGWKVVKVEILAEEIISAHFKKDITAKDLDTWTIWAQNCRVGVSKPVEDTMSSEEYTNTSFGFINKLDLPDHVYRRGVYKGKVLENSFYWCIPASANNNIMPSLSRTIVSNGNEHLPTKLCWDANNNLELAEGFIFKARQDTVLINFDSKGPHV